jgi:hypothetical protein
MRLRGFRWLGLLVLAAPACGSGSGAAFTPTTPVADVCSMLALSDVQVLMPGASAGTPIAPDDNADAWIHGCEWHAGPLAVSLILMGALTSHGNLELDVAVSPTSNSTTQATAVSGLGDKATYVTHTVLTDQILNAKKGSTVVSLAAYNFTPAASEAALEPLVVEVLGKL